MISSEDKKISERFRRENPFTVPEGYFDNLTANVMSQIPSMEITSEVDDHVVKTTGVFHDVSVTKRRARIFTIVGGIVAACLIVCLVVPGLLTKDGNWKIGSSTEQRAENTDKSVVYDEDYREEALNYAMVDYNDVYSYLSGANYY